MAQPDNRGLQASLRRKLKAGQWPEDLVKELVGGGMSEALAQRFVDQALAADRPQAADQFAPPEPEGARAAATVKLLIATLLMIGGVGWYMRTDPAQRVPLMWAPIVLGLLVFLQSLQKGLNHPMSFPWFIAIVSLAAPAGLAAWFVGVAASRETVPLDEEKVRAKVQELVTEALKGQAQAQAQVQVPGPATTPPGSAPAAPTAEQIEAALKMIAPAAKAPLAGLIKALEDLAAATTPADQCRAARALGDTGFGSEQAHYALLNLLVSSIDNSVRDCAEAALKKIGK
jgi:hypothetical protein